MKKHTKKLMLMTVISLSLAACGKVDYTGTYSGTETQSSATNGYSGNATVSNTTLALSQSGNQLVGTYTNTPTNNGYNNYGGSTQTVSGQFMASVDKNNINSATLTIGSSQYNSGGFGSSCAGQYTGSLSGTSDAQMITGTLTSAANSTCGGQVSKNLMLRKQ